MFTNQGSQDYTVQTNSPAIDAGKHLVDVIEDYEGTPRPQDRNGALVNESFRWPALLPAAAQQGQSTEAEQSGGGGFGDDTQVEIAERHIGAVVSAKPDIVDPCRV